jgi:ClpP class serine protease
LVDELGGLETALNEAAKLAKITTYKTVSVIPRPSKGNAGFANALVDQVSELVTNSAHADLLQLIITNEQLKTQDRVQARLLTEIEY